MEIGKLCYSDIPGYSLETRSSPGLKEKDVYHFSKTLLKEKHLKDKELDTRVMAAVAELQARDREVRSHESAHLSAAGGYARGGASFVYVKGPDGRLYAVGGEVGIDSSPVAGNPEETIRKAGVVRQAAMAPANPSPQDRRMAAMASRMEQNARLELLLKKNKEPESSRPFSDALKSYDTVREKLEKNTLDLIV